MRSCRFLSFNFVSGLTPTLKPKGFSEDLLQFYKERGKKN